MAAGFAVAFFATEGAAFFGADVDFLDAGADFLAAAGALRAGVDLLGAAFFVAVGTTFFAAGADFLVGAAFFTTGFAFFFERAGDFVAVRPTVADGFLFPVRDAARAVERAAGNFLTWEPLLAGV
ncbi:MAG: hypothetical protein JO368_01845, partial [Acidimicrobiales bacterium]|nr:hypothetical protein [Acidimicrobiales bacterium]